MIIPRSTYLSTKTTDINNKVAEIEVFDKTDIKTGNIIYDCIELKEFTQNGIIIEKYVLHTTAGKVVLNTTNRIKLIDELGDNSNNWIGESIKFKIVNNAGKSPPFDKELRIFPIKQKDLKESESVPDLQQKP